MEWFEIRILTELPLPLKEIITHTWFELGALGVDESEIIKGKPRFSAYFEQGNKEKIISEWTAYLETLDSPRKIDWQAIPVLQENWAEKYREFYRAQKLSHSFFLKPAWDEMTAAPQDLITIRMDPGQAFGTGLHATTRLTLQLFERSLGYYLDASRLSLIDVGTGTGILAIAASKLGVGKITAVDVDPIAVETAHENFQTNHTTEIALSDTPIQNIHEKFDIILANILLETHMELLKEYKRLMKPRGHLILSGLLAWQKAPILAALKKEGFITEVIDHLQDWLGVYAISRD